MLDITITINGEKAQVSHFFSQNHPRAKTGVEFGEIGVILNERPAVDVFFFGPNLSLW